MASWSVIFLPVLGSVSFPVVSSYSPWWIALCIDTAALLSTIRPKSKASDIVTSKFPCVKSLTFAVLPSTNPSLTASARDTFFQNPLRVSLTWTESESIRFFSIASANVRCSPLDGSKNCPVSSSKTPFRRASLRDIGLRTSIKRPCSNASWKSIFLPNRPAPAMVPVLESTIPSSTALSNVVTLPPLVLTKVDAGSIIPLRIARSVGSFSLVSGLVNFPDLGS